MFYKRIQIVGPSGSGKTTLAKTLSKKLAIPHYELDALFWLPDWKEKSQAEFEKEVKAITKQDKWILCGDYINRLQGATLQNAEMVIWLNYPLRIFISRMIRRSTKRLFTREKLWGNNRESFFNFWFRPRKSLLFITISMHFKQGRRRQEAKMKAYGYNGEMLEFNHPREVSTWLDNL